MNTNEGTIFMNVDQTNSLRKGVTMYSVILSRWHLFLIALLSVVVLSSCDILDVARELCLDTDTYVVDTVEEDDDPNSLCLEGAPCTLQAAIRSANFCRGAGPKTIRLQEDATYFLSHPYPAGGADALVDERENARAGKTGLPRVYGTVTIEGNGATITRTLIPPDEPFRIIHVHPRASLTLKDVTVSHGKASVSGPGTLGAGIFNEGTLIIENSTIARNYQTHSPSRYSQRGGAIHNTGTLEIYGGFMYENKAYGGSAIYNASNGTARIIGTTIYRHTVYNGSVLYNEPEASLELVDVTFITNESLLSPIVNHGQLEIAGSTFAFNSGALAGVIEHFKGESRISRSTFTQNRTTAQFGTSTIRCSSYYEADGLTLEDVTIYQNEGLSGFAAVNTCFATISNTLIAENTLEQCSFSDGATVILGGDSFASDETCVGFAYSLEIALLGPLSDYGGPTQTRLPLSVSPVINLGSRCLEIDQRGQPRRDGHCDIGAAEIQPSED